MPFPDDSPLGPLNPSQFSRGGGSPHSQNWIKPSDTVKSGPEGQQKSTSGVLGDIDAALAGGAEGRPERPKSIFAPGGMMHSTDEDLAEYDRAHEQVMQKHYDAIDRGFDDDLPTVDDIVSRMSSNRVDDMKNDLITRHDRGEKIRKKDFRRYEVGSQGNAHSGGLIRQFSNMRAYLNDSNKAWDWHRGISERMNKSEREARQANLTAPPRHQLFDPMFEISSNADMGALDYQQRVLGHARTTTAYGEDVSELGNNQSVALNEWRRRNRSREEDQ